ncbi:DUF6575 domain-containing protein [Caloramator proteoclasticus]|uniref:DUF6575 domain-containing protein n=1 Tax=Caloramator proteoclasticus DSM 10124 TaxID=1121262 RepID=A0A1M4T604_9CLOT|nr:DUF6575 domain-containing protein [Caloramator proteoclasticus]SHE39728.1 hypothetical protein SAMN02746091_00321 [Caloramator proteoclasticus DSM 10124]
MDFKNNYIDKIGEVKMRKVLDSVMYEEPITFSCENEKGVYFIATMINQEENEEVWFFIPVEYDELLKIENKVENSEFNILYYFLNSIDDKKIYQVCLYPDGSSSSECINISLGTSVDFPF